MKEITPLRVWLFALIILAMLAALGAILLVVLEDPVRSLIAHKGFGTACEVVTTDRFMLPGCA